MLYFIYGGSEKEVESSLLIEKIKKENQGINEIIYDFAQKESEPFLESVRQNSMFFSKELIVGKRAENIKKIDDFIEILSIYDVNVKEIIIEFDDSEIKIKTAIIKKLKEFAEVIEVKDDGKNSKLTNYILQNSRLDVNDASRLIEMVGKDYNKIKNELEKIKNYFGSEKIDLKKCDSLISKSNEYKLYEIIGKVFFKDIKDAIDYLDKTGSYMLILYSIQRELVSMLKLKILLKEIGIDLVSTYNIFSKEIYPKLKDDYFGHPFAIFKKCEILNTYSIKKIEELIKAGIEAELKIKKGIMEDDSAIKMFLFKFKNI